MQEDQRKFFQCQSSFIKPLSRYHKTFINWKPTKWNSFFSLYIPLSKRVKGKKTRDCQELIFKSTSNKYQVKIHCIYISPRTLSPFLCRALVIIDVLQGCVFSSLTLSLCSVRLGLRAWALGLKSGIIMVSFYDIICRMGKVLLPLTVLSRWLSKYRSCARVVADVEEALSKCLLLLLLSLLPLLLSSSSSSVMIPRWRIPSSIQFPLPLTC